tara:strand:+ start:2044 stop:2613 length:570 start_codon:yes stop_codon:yes gene_type:complete
MVECKDSADVTWSLDDWKMGYFPAGGPNGQGIHYLLLWWKWTLKCPGTCESTETSIGRCLHKTSKTGKFREEHNLKRVRNRGLSPSQKAALKLCYRQGRAGFLDCARDAGIVRNPLDLVDPDVLLGPEDPSKAGKCACKYRIIAQRSFDAQAFGLNNYDRKTEYKFSRKDEEAFWKYNVSHIEAGDLSW